MGLETGTYIDDLVATNPLGADDRKEGDNHLRLLKSVAKNTFPNASKAFRFPTSAAAQTTNFAVSFPSDQNKVFPVDASGGAITVTLPDPSSGGTVHEDGFAVTIIKIDSSTNAVTLQTSGVQTINGNNAPQLGTAFAMAHLVWCKTAARWIAITPNILSFLYLYGALQSINADNTSAEKSHLFLQRGTGAGDNVFFRTIGDAANGVSQLLLDIGSERVVQWLKTFVQVGKNFFVGTIGSAGTWGVLTSGHVHNKHIATPSAPAAGISYSYFKTGGLLHAFDETGAERCLEIGQIVGIVEDQKAQNTAAQTLNSGSDQVRELTTLVYARTLAGTPLVSLSSNRFTLPAGTWEIDWYAPVSGGSNHQSLLHNQTDATDVARGSCGRSEGGSGITNGMSGSFGRTVVTITSSKDFEIRHRVEGTALGGNKANFGTEIYTRVVIRRA